MDARICDKCNNFYSNAEQTREWCSKKREGTKFTNEFTAEYIDKRINGDAKNCKGYKKI